MGSTKKLIHKYRTPKVFDTFDGELYAAYPQGAHLILDNLFWGKKTVYGWASIDSDIELVKKEFEEHWNEGNVGLRVQTIGETGKTIYLDTPISINSAWNDNINPAIENEVVRLEKVYGVSRDAIRIGYYKNTLNAGLVIFVSCDESLTKEELSHRFGNSIQYRAYNELFVKKKNTAKEDIFSFDNNPIVATAKRNLASMSFRELYKFVSDRVLGQEELRRVCVGIYAYLKSIAHGGKISNSNILIVGDTGTGKTQTYRAIKEYTKEILPELPVVFTDLSNITSAGFKGKDPEVILKGLNGSKYGGYGIVFLDEIDKKITPSYDGNGKNVNEEVMGQILTMIEGAEIRTKDDGIIDTNKTLFILMGSFESLRRARATRTPCVGFGSDNSKKEVTHDLSRDEIIEFGATRELMGRIPIITNYHPLDRSARMAILRRCIEKIASMLNVHIDVSKKLIESIAVEELKKGGAREYDAIIIPKVYDAYAEGVEIAELFSIKLDWDDRNAEITYSIEEEDYGDL